VEERATSAVFFVTVNFAAEFSGLRIHHGNNITAPNPKGTGVTFLRQKAQRYFILVSSVITQTNNRIASNIYAYQYNMK